MQTQPTTSNPHLENRRTRRPYSPGSFQGCTETAPNSCIFSVPSYRNPDAKPYRVDVIDGTCTCGDCTGRQRECKHLRDLKAICVGAALNFTQLQHLRQKWAGNEAKQSLIAASIALRVERIAAKIEKPVSWVKAMYLH